MIETTWGRAAISITMQTTTIQILAIILAIVFYYQRFVFLLYRLVIEPADCATSSWLNLTLRVLYFGVVDLITFFSFLFQVRCFSRNGGDTLR